MKECPTLNYAMLSLETMTFVSKGQRAYAILITKKKQKDKMKLPYIFMKKAHKNYLQG